MRKYNNKSNLAGPIIKKYRKEKNMKKEDLCTKLQLLGINIDRIHLYRLENSSVIIKDFELIAICKILKIDFESLKKELDN